MTLDFSDPNRCATFWQLNDPTSDRLGNMRDELLDIGDIT